MSRGGGVGKKRWLEEAVESAGLGLECGKGEIEVHGPGAVDDVG